jgi:hypothetical protein
VARQVGALSPGSALAGSEDEDGHGISYTGGCVFVCVCMCNACECKYVSVRAFM